MANYRRHYVPGGTYFFTLVTAHRIPWLAREDGRRVLGDALRTVRAARPFRMDAIVVLPDHLHCIWTLPDGDSDFSGRWKSIKHRCTRRLRATGWSSRTAPWQRHYWEHLIRDEEDFRNHLDYVHYNPVKHGLCDVPSEWPASSFDRYVDAGVYSCDWGGPSIALDVPE